jgi:hypothetical protein
MKSFLMKVIKYIILYLLPVSLVKKLRFLRFRFHNAADGSWHGLLLERLKGHYGLVHILTAPTLKALTVVGMGASSERVASSRSSRVFLACSSFPYEGHKVVS